MGLCFLRRWLGWKREAAKGLAACCPGGRPGGTASLWPAPVLGRRRAAMNNPCQRCIRTWSASAVCAARPRHPILTTSSPWRTRPRASAGQGPGPAGGVHRGHAPGQPAECGRQVRAALAGQPALGGWALRDVELRPCSSLLGVVPACFYRPALPHSAHQQDSPSHLHCLPAPPPPQPPTRRCFEEGLFEAARVIFTRIPNYGRLASTLVKLHQFQAAVDAARKANSPKTWKEVGPLGGRMGGR